MKIFNTYDPSAVYPQPARFGLGRVNRHGQHTPLPGLAGHDVTGELIHGIDDEFYETTAPDVLTPKSQTEVDAIIAQRAADKAAEQQAKEDKRNEVSNEYGQVGGLPETNLRIDNLIQRLEDLDVKIRGL